MNRSLVKDKDYSAWLKELKNKVRLVQIQAAVKINTELLLFYWELGLHIADKQKNATWGEGFLKQLSIDLMTEFPDMKGFSKRNLELIRQWYSFWHKETIAKQPVNQNLQQTPMPAKKSFGQQAVAQLMQIPWGHNIVIISKCKNPEEACFYFQQPTPGPSQEGNIISGLSRKGNISASGKKKKSLLGEGGPEGREGYKDIPGFCNSASIERVRELDYVLTAARYVGLPDEFKTSLPSIEEIEAELSGEE